MAATAYYLKGNPARDKYLKPHQLLPAVLLHKLKTLLHNFSEEYEFLLLCLVVLLVFVIHRIAKRYHCHGNVVLMYVKSLAFQENTVGESFPVFH